MMFYRQWRDILIAVVLHEYGIKNVWVQFFLHPRIFWLPTNETLWIFKRDRLMKGSIRWARRSSVSSAPYRLKSRISWSRRPSRCSPVTVSATRKPLKHQCTVSPSMWAMFFWPHHLLLVPNKLPYFAHSLACQQTPQKCKVSIFPFSYWLCFLISTCQMHLCAGCRRGLML